MFVLQIDNDEKDFLISVLKRNRTAIATNLSTKLKATQYVFGVVMRADEDVKSLLQQHHLSSSHENIDRVRASYFGRHIDDHMVEHGWEVLEEAVLELKSA